MKKSHVAVFVTKMLRAVSTADSPTAASPPEIKNTLMKSFTREAALKIPADPFFTSVVFQSSLLACQLPLVLLSLNGLHQLARLH